jgi:hypothetical protein
MTGPGTAVSTGEIAGLYVARISVHLARLAQGRDPFGHLFAIERLSRAARAEWLALERQTAGEKSRRGEP